MSISQHKTIIVARIGEHMGVEVGTAETAVVK